MMGPHARSATSLAKETGVAQATLSRCLTQARTMVVGTSVTSKPSWRSEVVQERGGGPKLAARRPLETEAVLLPARDDHAAASPQRASPRRNRPTSSRAPPTSSRSPARLRHLKRADQPSLRNHVATRSPSTLAASATATKPTQLAASTLGFVAVRPAPSVSPRPTPRPPARRVVGRRSEPRDPAERRAERRRPRSRRAPLSPPALLSSPPPPPLTHPRTARRRTPCSA